MTRGKASTSAWNRPGSPQRPIGTTRSRTCAARRCFGVGRLGVARPQEER